MWGNLIKTAWRNLKSHKLFALINLFGLAVGLAYCAAIAVLEGIQYNADAFHEKAERIYGLVQVNPSGNAGEEHSAFNPGPLLEALRADFPDIEDGTRALPAGRLIVKSRDKVLVEPKGLFVDANFLSIFTFPLVYGDSRSALARPGGVILSEQAALKYFGRPDPLGETLTLNGQVQVSVTGVSRNLDQKSSIRFDLLASLETARPLVPDLDDWSKSTVSTFVLLKPGTDPQHLATGFPAFGQKVFDSGPTAPKKLYLLPLLDFRLHSFRPFYVRTFLQQLDPTIVAMQLGSAVLVLLIACLNFMNLATARSLRRAREVGLRKCLGASRGALIRQFLGESVLLTLLALPLALLLYGLMMPAFFQSTGFSSATPIWNHPFLFKYFLGVTILVGLAAGLYPAFCLSAFQPVKVLKGNASSGKRGSVLRKVMVMFQFAMAVFLIVWTMHFKKQYEHLAAADFGYDRSRILAVPVQDASPASVEVLKKEIARSPGVTAVSAAAGLPGGWGPEANVIPEGVGDTAGWKINTYGVDVGYCELLGIPLRQGRTFSREFNDAESVIISELLSRQLHWDRPLGRRIAVDGRTRTVVGVVRDFHFRPAFFPLAPALFTLEKEKADWVLVKYGADTDDAAVAAEVKKAWQAVLPDQPFEWLTLDEHFKNTYAWMNRVYAAMGVVDLLVILVACLGLLALASYAVEKRTKEVGVRKVLGASAPDILRLLTREFLSLVLLANLVALPLSVWASYKIMQIGNAFSTVVPGLGVCLLAVALTVPTALLAVGGLVWKAARANPVECLRYE